MVAPTSTLGRVEYVRGWWWGLVCGITCGTFATITALGLGFAIARGLVP